MSKQNISKVSEKPIPSLPEITGVAILWWWGSIILYSPYYLNIVGLWRIVPNAIGASLIIISMAGAVMELGNIWKNEGWDYIGVSLIALIPAIISRWVVTSNPVIFPLDIALKIVELILLAIGGAVLIKGLLLIFWKPAEQRKVTKKRGNIKTIVSFIIPLLNLVTTIVKLIWEFRK